MPLDVEVIGSQARSRNDKLGHTYGILKHECQPVPANGLRREEQAISRPAVIAVGAGPRAASWIDAGWIEMETSTLEWVPACPCHKPCREAEGLGSHWTPRRTSGACLFLP